MGCTFYRYLYFCLNLYPYLKYTTHTTMDTLSYTVHQSIWGMLIIEAPGHSDYFVNVNCRRRKYRPLAYVLIEKET